MASDCLKPGGAGRCHHPVDGCSTCRYSHAAAAPKVASDAGAGLRERMYAVLHKWDVSDFASRVCSGKGHGSLPADICEAELDAFGEELIAALATDAADNLVDNPLNTSGVVRSEAGFDDTQATDATDADDREELYRLISTWLQSLANPKSWMDRLRSLFATGGGDLLEQAALVLDDMWGEGPSGSYDNGATSDGWNMACNEAAKRIRALSARNLNDKTKDTDDGE